MIFENRSDAGRQLAERLAPLKDRTDVIVLGIPRGGVVVAAEIARALNAPLDIFLAHKLGAPGNPELAIGAVTSSEIWLDADLVRELRLKEFDIAREADYQRQEIERRLNAYRQNRPPLDVQNKTVILADDGVATGSTMIVALRALRQQNPAQLIVAIPIGPGDTVEKLKRECDQVVALDTPAIFWAVGRFYRNFEQVTDEEVVRLLEENNKT